MSGGIHPNHPPARPPTAAPSPALPRARLLTPRLRRALELEGRRKVTQAVACRELGISRSALAMRLCRARRQLGLPARRAKRLILKTSALEVMENL